MVLAKMVLQAKSFSGWVVWGVVGFAGLWGTRCSILSRSIVHTQIATPAEPDLTNLGHVRSHIPRAALVPC